MQWVRDNMTKVFPLGDYKVHPELKKLRV